MKLLFKGMDSLFQKADSTEARYEKVLEEKQDTLIQLQNELQEKNLMLKDMHKMKLLGEITVEAYEEEAGKIAVLQKQVQELQMEVNLIEVYQTEDIKEVIEELDAEKRKVFQKHQGELKKIKMELLEAKLNYLKKQVEVRERYNELVSPERKLDALKIKMGIMKNSYIGDAFETLSMVSVGESYEPLVVEIHEVDSALRYGRLPEKLKKVVREAKEKGIID